MPANERKCDNCGREIEPGVIPYWVRLEIFASPEPPVIYPDDLFEDHQAKMAELIEQMEALGPEECEAQVYEAYKFVICPACRNYFHHHLRQRKKP
ncbi:MAG: hypothetical protein N3D11_13715 [Candidatus Sumerlaeia bacterium]|nr:hypothetical protein [Candidatus Sumerlaeia bacterium]